ncbi:MAG: LPS export ABC transporter permease LptF [Gammaproteobacteria bacterium]|nr:LPS export ABC transporter permease LptF [Gammaproteobacteria bacterium]
MMIISRYLFKETFQTLFAVTFILLLIFLSQQLVHYLSYAVSGKIAPKVLFEVIGFMIPWLLAFLLPLGLYLALLLTFSRLYADNELRVLHASGFSVWRLFTLTARYAAIVAVIVAILMFWINPLIASNRQKALVNGSIDTLMDTLMPGRFKVLQDGRRVVYVSKINRNAKRADNIFMAEQMPMMDPNDLAESKSWTVLSADQAYVDEDPRTDSRWIIAENGYRYKGVPGELNYQMIQFGSYRVRVPDLVSISHTRIAEAISTEELMATYKNDPVRAAEFQWRCAIPITALLLALLAVPMSRVMPRQGRYLLLLPALLFYVIYMNLLFVTQHLIEQGTLPIGIGMWWVHGIFLFLPLCWIVWRMKHV